MNHAPKDKTGLTDSTISQVPAELSNAARPPRWLSPLALASLILFSVILRAGIASIPLERDEGEYAYIAQRWLVGDIPYRDAFDQKTPAVFVAYAALFAAGFRSVEAIHWLGHAALVGTIIYVYLIGRRLFSDVVGWLAGLFSAILVMDANVLGNAANTEVFAILPLSAGIYYAIRAAQTGRLWDTLLTGICGGLALSCKQVTLPVVVFSFLWVLINRWRAWRSVDQRTADLVQPDVPAARSPRGLSIWSGAIWLGVGLALVWVPICGYFILHGAWTAFLDCVVGHNLAYSGRVGPQFYAVNFWNSSKFLYIVFGPLFASAAFGLGYAWRHGGSAIRLCAWWWFSAFLAASIGGYYRAHYLILFMPPFALLAAYGMFALAVVLEPKRQGSQAWVAAFLGIASICWPLFAHRNYYWAESPEFMCRQLYSMNPFPESPALGKFLRENSEPDDRIFVCGSEPQILFFAERASASRYIFVYPLFASADSLPRQKEVIEELRSHPPRFIVFVDPNVVRTSYLLGSVSPQYFFQGISDLLSKDYVQFAGSTFGVDWTTRMIRPAYNDQGQLDFVVASGEFITIRIFERRDARKSPKETDRSEQGMGSIQRQLEQNVTEVRGRIAAAAQVSGRPPDTVRLVAVTKTVDARQAGDLLPLGIRDLGESRPQELWRKHDLISGPVQWHLIGPLQKNKARRTLPMVQMVHSVDSESLLERLDQLAVELDLHPDVLLEVNVSGEGTKNGFRPDEMPGVIAGAAPLARVRVRGLMTMAPYDEKPENAGRFFAALRLLRDRLTDLAPPTCPLTELSMGMSGDFEVAVAEGATIVRIGSALFHGIVESA